jgi:parallel beta-helix repeat protein
VPGDYATIQAAVEAASNGDEILVAPGTYTGTGYWVINPLGKQITIRATGTAEETILDGEGQRNVVACSNSEGINTVIEGFTITGGDSEEGGGIHCYDSNPMLTDCTITGNTAYKSGGGIFCESSSPTITGCTISDNTAADKFGKGGGIYCYDSSPTLTDTTVCGNAPDQIDGFWSDQGGNSIDTECCPDPTNDGMVSSDDVQSIMNAWNCMTCDSDDVNFDGVVDVRGLLVALAAWGPCE